MFLFYKIFAYIQNIFYCCCIFFIHTRRIFIKPKKKLRKIMRLLFCHKIKILKWKFKLNTKRRLLFTCYMLHSLKLKWYGNEFRKKSKIIVFTWHFILKYKNNKRQKTTKKEKNENKTKSKRWFVKEKIKWNEMK